MNKKWVCNELNNAKVEELKAKHHLTDLLSSILVSRNIVEDNEIKTFLGPTRNDFYNPFLLPDMEKATDRVIKAIKTKEKIIIYGDYDVDGITSVCVLKKFLEERGISVSYTIPNRLEEGYGLNKEAIEKIAREKYELMITVDCGISGVEEVEYANSLGIETIITDHHEPLDDLPSAIAVIDAKRKDNIYPFNQLAGVGVVFKFIQAISKKLGLDEKEYLKYLDLVCIGTISDIVPLIDENRVIAKLGLKLVEVTHNIGLRALINSLGFHQMNSTVISFGIAPRINACGRMGHAEEALNLFLTNDKSEAQKLTNRLNEYNQVRQDIEKKIYEDAISKIKKENNKENNTIVLAGENWHHGVIGIVSSKITEMYFKPSILICMEGENGKGSGRSIPGFDLHHALCETSQYLQKFGGHSMAVGLSLQRENFKLFKQSFEAYAKKCKIDEIMPILTIDKQVTDKELTLQNIRDLEKLEPYGEANKCPLFLFKNLRIDSIRSLTEGKHMKLTLKSENNVMYTAIGFNLGYRANEFLIGDKVDIVCTLEINNFNGLENIQFNLKDLMKSIS